MPYRIGDHPDGNGQRPADATPADEDTRRSIVSGQAATGQGRAGQGTLLWIGDRDAPPYRDAYRYCDLHATQLANRATIDAAIERPATDVQAIVFCRDNDSTRHVDAFQSLRRRHAAAEAALLLGPLCAGSRPSPSSLFDAAAMYWHEWESRLPALLQRCGLVMAESPAPRSIAVVSESYATASALLAIAGTDKTVAVWCRPDQLGTVRGIDEFWWDDSATRGTNWSDLLDHPACRSGRHLWICNSVTPQRKQAAVEAGISEVIAKPGDYSSLLDRVFPKADTRERTAA
jgi:hypothetical protein